MSYSLPGPPDDMVYTVSKLVLLQDLYVHILVKYKAEMTGNSIYLGMCTYIPNSLKRYGACGRPINK